MEPVIATERFRLRLFDDSDVDELYSLDSDSEAVHFLPGQPSRELAAKSILAFTDEYERSAGGMLSEVCRGGHVGWAVCQSTSRLRIGQQHRSHAHADEGMPHIRGPATTQSEWPAPPPQLQCIKCLSQNQAGGIQRSGKSEQPSSFGTCIKCRNLEGGQVA